MRRQNPYGSYREKITRNLRRGTRELTLKDIGPVQPGVVLIVVRDPSLMMESRALFEECALYAKNIADLPMFGAETLVSLYGDGTRDLQLAQGLARRDARAPLLDKRMFFKELNNCRRPNAWSNEGVHIVLEHPPESGGYVTAEASIGEAREQIFVALERLEAGAREKNAHILLFVQSRNDDIAWLSDHCAELIVVDECEPGLGASCAFSLTAMSLQSQHAKGIGRTMCEVTAANNRLMYRTSVFIAASVHDRAMWYLWREGWSFGAIAEVSGYDKSTVMRRLKSLRLPRDVDADLDPPEGWHKEWFPFVGFETDGDDEAAPAPTRRGPIRI